MARFIKRQKMFLPLRAKFIILFFLLITIPFLVSGILTYNKYSSNVEMNERMYMQQIVEQLNVSLSRYIYEMERLTTSPLYDDGVMAILKAHDRSYQRGYYLSTDEQMKMNLFISALAFGRNEIQSIVFFTNDGNLFSNLEINVQPFWDLSSNEWMDSVRKDDGKLTILPSSPANYYKDGTHYPVSIARVIREPYSNKPLGIIKVDLQPNGIERILSSVSFRENNKLFISNKDDILIYPSSFKNGIQNVDPALNPSNKELLSASVQSDVTGITITGQIPKDDLREDAKKLTSYTLLISLISLFFAYILAVVSSNRLIKPIRHLQSKMKLVQMGAFNERAEVTTHDEIGHLTTVFNLMVGNIDQLVKEVYETKLREREAELSALQSQINPHFLYNTLESINMLAVKGNELDLSNMVTNLGKLLRYTVDTQDRPVFLKDEIHFVEAYLSIQGFRLGDMLQTELYMDPALETVLVPKLILQPLVENAIEHSIGEEPVKITLRAQIIDDDLLLTVTDNGIGISEEKLASVKKSLNLAKMNFLERHAFGVRRKGYALCNVHQRIRLLYGEAYGLSIDSKKDKGTTSVIRLPFQWEESDV